jgi:23S rRNA (guanosine2251-2'-O)-methyltransferase
MLSEAQEKGEAPFVILLDGITDPHNLGAIIRTAECVGAHGVIVPERRSVGLTPAAVKASAGAVGACEGGQGHKPQPYVGGLENGGALDRRGRDGRNKLSEGGSHGPAGAGDRIGGRGHQPLVLENCDRKVSLPLKGKIGSLNASVAAGISDVRGASKKERRINDF